MIATALTNLELFYERNMTSAIQYRKEKSSKQKLSKQRKLIRNQVLISHAIVLQF